MSTLAVESIAEQWGRPASVLVPSSKQRARKDSSWIGRVTLARPDEAWPQWQDRPLAPLCQLRLDQAPFVPEELSDIACITIFADFDEEGVAETLLDEHDKYNQQILVPNGRAWALRAYESMDELVEIRAPKAHWPFSARPGEWVFVERDLPTDHEFPDGAVETALWPIEAYDARRRGIRIGGWPSITQDPLPWGPRRLAPMTPFGGPVAWSRPKFDPQYVLEVTSMPECDLWIYDDGAFFFGRGRKNRSRWCSSSDSA
ncbi:MAG: hypothetical protein RIB58_00025 [Phycisphaerales bacterium]